MKEKSKNIKFDYPLYDEIDGDLSGITALYLRVSTDTQAQDGYGLDVQYSALYKYCQAYGLSNPVIFIDDGYTGVNDSRPAFKSMLDMMKKGRIKFIITYSLDRIGRTQMLILKFLKEECERAKCDFLAVKDNVDSRSKQTYGILISILSIFAEFDHDAIVAKLTLGRKQRALEGFWKGGGIPPFGYIYSKAKNNLIPDPQKSGAVKAIFDMYNSGEYSPAQIARIMGMSSDVMVFGVLKNRTYLGEITFKGVQYEGKHQPLIDRESFDLAQERLKIRSVARSDTRYLLSSIIYCGNCGGKMRYMKWGKGVNQTLKIVCYRRYSGKFKPKNGVCDNIIYSAEEVERAVVGEIMRFSVDYSREITQNGITAEQIIDGMNRRLSVLKGEYNRLLTAYKRLGNEDILEQAAATDSEYKKLEREIAEEREKQNMAKRIESNENMLKTLPDTWKKMTASERQNIVRSLVKKIVLNGGNIEVFLNKTQYEKIVLGEIDS